MSKMFTLSKILNLNYTCFLILFILFSCNSNSKRISQDKIINVMFDDINSLKFSEYFSELEFIPLETNINNLFKKISEIRIKGERIFVFSEAPDNMISIYDLCGNSICAIRNIGKGPGEINYATSFELDTTILILDRGNRKILKYNLDGRFLSEIDLNGMYFSKFSVLQNSIFVLYDEMPYELQKNKHNILIPQSKLTFWKLTENQKLKQIASAPNLNSNKKIHMLLKNYFSIYERNLIYWDVFNDKMNVVDLNSFNYTISQKVNFGKFKMTETAFNNYFEEELQPFELLKIIRKGYAFIYDYYFFQNKSQFFMIRKNFIDYTGILKENEFQLKTYLKLNFDNIHNNLNVNIAPKALYPIYYDKERAFYFSWEVSDFMKTFNELKSQFTAKEWKSFLVSNPSLKNCIEKTGSNDNPLIIKAILK